jgi:hypothetical protein
MAVRLIAEVLKYAGAHPDVTTGERLVLILIAERANGQTREAWSGGADVWSLGQAAGMAPTTLRTVLQRLAKRGLELRVSRGTDSKGRPVYASWNRQTTYRLPLLLADEPPSAVGDEPPSRTEEPAGDEQRALGDEPPSVGDEHSALGDEGSSPFSSVPSLETSVTVTNHVPRARTRPAQKNEIDPTPPTPLRVLPGTGATSPPVATQPALWPRAVREEPDVNATQARQTAREAIRAATLARTTKLARQVARGETVPVSAAVAAEPRAPGAACDACGAELDPDRTCFVCRDGRIQAAS